MKPIKLRMQAFASYGKLTEIDFTIPNQNLFLITGDTGAGKTTIFDAIVFALYGEASSGNNKKDGILLQSQYVGLDREPFVELTFTEGGDDVYKVCRVPRHLRLKSRAVSKGSSYKEVSGSVTLYMPDGLEYPSKEANNKIESIVGLTKDQFMQVAMIAQGEFMELLRAKSDEKKIIFRKLFHTELYEKVVEELKNRRQAKEKDLAIMKTQCQTIADNICVKEAYERREEIEILQEQMMAGKLSQLGEFTEEIGLYADYLKKEWQQEKKAKEEAQKTRDASRDACTEAEHLMQFFQQKENAEKELQELEKKADVIAKKELLAEELRKAWELQGDFCRLADKKKQLAELEKALDKEKEQLPQLVSNEEAKKKQREEKETIYREVLKKNSKVQERVKRAYEAFDEKEKNKKELEARIKACESAKKELEEAEKEKKSLEASELSYKKEEENLAKSGENLLECNNQISLLNDLLTDAKNISSLFDGVEESARLAKQSKEDYLKAKEDYVKKQNCHEKYRQSFLDAQAGFLAEELVDGSPCPVCGSREHPAPCHFSKEEEVSREKLEKLADEAGKSLEKQQKLAEKVSSLDTSYHTQKENLEKSYRDLRKKILTREMMMGERAVKEEIENVEECLDNALDKWTARKSREEENLGKLDKARKALEKMNEEKKKLGERVSQASSQQVKAMADVEAGKALLRKTEESLEFTEKEEADRLLVEANDELDKAKEAYQQTKEDSEDAREAKVQCATRIEKYEKELPEVKKEKEDREKNYLQAEKQLQISEKKRENLVQTHDKEEIQQLIEEVEVHKRKLSGERKLLSSAQEAIAGRKRPDRDKLALALQTAETKLKAAEEFTEAGKSLYDIHKNIYDKMLPLLEERQDLVREHARLDGLYRMVSGNVKDARMDLETFVQRYYMDKILYAANRRFTEMSAGQYELRMISEEKAGSGRNRGLDLMVYSNVTGKEREIRTLSGGESFMAALALALGMADTIRENSSAVNLDIMFIDEGFGSLDEHSRNQAVRVLLEMAEGNRMIGIISHVSELQQEIEDQLLVKKNEEGSYVHWQIS